MAVLKILTDYAFIVETNQGEKIGVLINHDEDSTPQTGIEFLSPDGSLTFSTIQELEEIFGEAFTYKEVEVKDSTTSSKSIGDYPVNDTDSIFDVQLDESTGMNTFSKSKRSKKRFYPGWWLVRTEAGSYNPRMTISTDIYDERNSTEALYGPYKTYMEVTYALKGL